MSEPVRVQLSRRKGWRMPPNTVKADRSTDLGNPFPVDVYGRAGAVDKHRRWLTGNMSAREMSESSRCDRWPDISLVTIREWQRKAIKRHAGKNMACWCGLDEECHVDNILALAAQPNGGGDG
jgi:hypothetical protein